MASSKSSAGSSTAKPSPSAVSKSEPSTKSEVSTRKRPKTNTTNSAPSAVTAKTSAASKGTASSTVAKASSSSNTAPLSDVDGIGDTAKMQSSGTGDGNDAATMDPYVIYALRPPHERAASVVPRMAKAQPDLSPANHRFTRIMSGRGSVKDTLPMQYEPRWDSFASSEIATESSFTWSERTRKSARRREGKTRRSRTSTPSAGSATIRGTGNTNDISRSKSRTSSDGVVKRTKGPILVPEYASAFDVESDGGAHSVSYVQDTDARKKPPSRGGPEGDAPVDSAVDSNNTGAKIRRKLPHDLYSQPDTPSRTVSFQNLRKIHSHRRSDPRWRYRGSRLRFIPALRKVVPTGTQSVASFRLFGIFARPQAMKSERGSIRTPQLRPRRSWGIERRKSGSSASLSAGQPRRPSPPAHQGGIRRRRRSRTSRTLPALEAAITEDLIETPRGAAEAVSPVSTGVREEIDLADAGNLSSGVHGKIFQRRVGLTREERVQRVFAWQEKYFGQPEALEETRESAKRRDRGRRPHSLDSANIEGRRDFDLYEARPFRRSKGKNEKEEAEPKSRRSRLSRRSRALGEEKQRKRKAKASDIPSHSQQTAFTNHNSHADQPRREDSEEELETDPHGECDQPLSAPAAPFAAGRRKFPNLAKFHLRSKGKENPEDTGKHDENGGGGGRPRRRNRKGDKKIKNRERTGETQATVADTEAGGRHASHMWMRIIGK